MRHIPLDAIPDLSDVQVIIKTTYPGQAPQVVEDQVTYPITTALRAVTGAVTVRGYSMFGDSYVYVVFRDGTDPYWARSRVLEFLNQVTRPSAGGGAPRARSRRHRRWAGSTNTPWWTAPAGTIWRSCAACRTGS